MNDKEVKKFLFDQISKKGDLKVSQYIDIVLYNPIFGFYNRPSSKNEHYITSASLGLVFAEVVYNFVQNWWRSVGQPDQFSFIEVGINHSSIGKQILEKNTYLNSHINFFPIERARSSLVVGTDDIAKLEEQEIGIVFCNELLDNLAFDLVRFDDSRWKEIKIGFQNGHLAEVLHEIDDPAFLYSLSKLDLKPTEGSVIPIQTGAMEWLRNSLKAIKKGTIIAIDYFSSTAEMINKTIDQWLRMYRHHQRISNIFFQPSFWDITVDVAVDQLSLVKKPTQILTQHQFLTQGSIMDLIKDAKTRWINEKEITFESLKNKSLALEAQALLDFSGMGSFQVLRWVK